MAVLFPPVSLLMNSSIEDIAIGKLASYGGWQPHCPADDRFWHFGDIDAALFNVQFRATFGHQSVARLCRRMTQSGH